MSAITFLWAFAGQTFISFVFSFPGFVFIWCELSDPDEFLISSNIYKSSVIITKYYSKVLTLLEVRYLTKPGGNL